MKHFLFFFMDGVGLGENNPQINPFSRVHLPTLSALLDKNAFVENTAPYSGQRASLLAIDARLGIAGLPQSATGQATLVTGENIPALIGYHYGPKPNQPIASYLRNGNIFDVLNSKRLSSALINAYPPRYFDAIESGRRIYSAFPMAATSAGLQLKTIQDLRAGAALAADFTAQGWQEHLGLTDIPILSPHDAGKRLADLAVNYDFTFFEYWLTDYAGHRQDMDQAVTLLRLLDKVLESLTQTWNDELGLILITSDHGNLEDLSTRRHTLNPVPALLIGSSQLRNKFTENIHSIADIAPAIINLLTG